MFIHSFAHMFCGLTACSIAGSTGVYLFAHLARLAAFGLLLQACSQEARHWSMRKVISWLLAIGRICLGARDEARLS